MGWGERRGTGRTSIIKITSQITSGNKSAASGRPQPQKLDEKGVLRRRLTSTATYPTTPHPKKKKKTHVHTADSKRLLEAHFLQSEALTEDLAPEGLHMSATLPGEVIPPLV